MAIYLSQRWRRKPPLGAVVDRTHPLAREVRFFIDCRGGYAVDLVRGIQLTRSGTIGSGHDPKFADEVSVPDSTDHFSLSNAGSLQITGSISLIWRGYVDVLQDTQFASKSDSSFGEEFMWFLTAAGEWRFKRADAAFDNRVWQASASLSADVWYTLGVTQGATINLTPTGWRDRTATTWSSIEGTSTAAAKATDGDVRIGRDATTIYQLNGSVSYAMGFARAISEAEYLALEENPWQILRPDQRRIYVNIAAGTVVTPSKADLTLTGFSPSVQRTEHQTVTPSKGDLTLTGFAPTVVVAGQGVTVQPGKADLSLDGRTPTVAVTEHKTVTPGKGDLTLTGHAPAVSVTTNNWVQPGRGDVTLTGFAPTVLLGVVVQPSQGNLALTGLAPVVTVTQNHLVNPGTSAISVTGFAPTIVGGETPVIAGAGGGASGAKKYYPVGNLDLETWRKSRKIRARVTALQKKIEQKRDLVSRVKSLARVEAIQQQIVSLQRQILKLLEALDELRKEDDEMEAVAVYVAYKKFKELQ